MLMFIQKPFFNSFWPQHPICSSEDENYSNLSSQGGYVIQAWLIRRCYDLSKIKEIQCQKLEEISLKLSDGHMEGAA